MSVNKNEKMIEYISDYPELGAYLKFNTVDNSPGERSISTVYDDVWEVRHIRNHGIKRYDFAVVLIQNHDTGTSSFNANEMFDAEKFMEWIDEQNKNKRFPDFGKDANIISIENLQNMPNLAGVDNSGTVAKYMFQCRVRYSV